MARKSEGLSERHRKIMDFLQRFQKDNGYSPSIREIGDHIGVKSTSLVDYYLNQLAEMGHISRDGRVSRSIRVVRPIRTAQEILTRVGKDVLPVPLMGRIVASAPIPMPASDLPYFDPDSTVEIATSMLPTWDRPNELFALEVQGDSMIDAMVSDGDIVIMRKAASCANGEMVAVWLTDRDETTLKYFYMENNRIRLQPANPSMSPIYVDNPQAVRIMGKVVMIIRQMPNIVV